MKGACFYIRNNDIRNMRLKSGKKLRNTGRPSCRGKLEKYVFQEKFLTELEAKYKQHPSLNFF